MTDNPVRFSACPICDGSITNWRTKVVDEVSYAIDRCFGCGYAFVNPRPPLEFLFEFYSKNGHKKDGTSRIPDIGEILEREKVFPNSELDAARIVSRCAAETQTTGAQKRFLDVGCGYGFFSREAKRSGFSVTAIELADNERLIARQLAELEPVSSTFEEFSSDKPFDVILMSQILEHAFDPMGWLEKAKAMLVPGGVVAIALPNFDGILRRILQEREPYICPPAHLNFFSENSLRLLLRRVGLDVVGVEWTSRLPVSAFSRRLPGPTKLVAPTVHAAVGFVLGAADSAGLGQMVTVYGRQALG